jgi:hypothetical protein
VVFYRQALNIGDLAQAETHRMDIEVVRYVVVFFPIPQLEMDLEWSGCRSERAG